MTDSGKTLDGKKIEYEILEDGYRIYLDGDLFIKWKDPSFGSSNLNYENEAIARIDSFISVDTSESSPTDIEQLRADVDYIAAMTGVTL